MNSLLNRDRRDRQTPFPLEIASHYYILRVTAYTFPFRLGYAERCSFPSQIQAAIQFPLVHAYLREAGELRSAGLAPGEHRIYVSPVYVSLSFIQDPNRVGI